MFNEEENIERAVHFALGGLPAGWIMLGFAILLARGENRQVSEWDVGCSGLV
jgi:hypothetical protein